VSMPGWMRSVRADEQVKIRGYTAPACAAARGS
jgi:hypothetical protein